MEKRDRQTYYFLLNKNLEQLPIITNLNELDNHEDWTFYISSEYAYESLSGKNRYNKYAIYNKDHLISILEYKGWKITNFSRDVWAEVCANSQGSKQFYVYQGSRILKLPKWYENLVALGLGGLFTTMAGKASLVKFYDPNNKLILLPVHGCTYLQASTLESNNHITGLKQSSIFYSGGNETSQGGGNDDSIIYYSLEILKKFSAFESWEHLTSSNF